MKSFIFSNKIAPRLSRHLAFWGIYFAGTLLLALPNIGRSGTGYNEVFATALSDGLGYLPIHLLAVYSTIYLIMPIYLRKRKLSLLLWYALVLFSITIPAGYYVTEVNFISRGYDSDVLDFFAVALHNCMANLITITGGAVIIKIMKDYWLRQRESEVLAIENIRNKLHLLKMQMHPRLLFASLQRIYLALDTATSEAPEMILKLSDLLSYLLYESDSEQVPLSDEVQMIENYLALKKLEFKRHLDIRFEISGGLQHQMIVPGLFLPLLETGIERAGVPGQMSAVAIELKRIGPKIIFRLRNDIRGTELAKDPAVQMTIRTVKERLRSAGFHRSRLDFVAGPTSVTIVMQLE